MEAFPDACLIALLIEAQKQNYFLVLYQLETIHPLCQQLLL